MNDNSLKVIEVDVNDILPNRFQPRIQFDENEILELSDSIKEHGVIQPLVVRPIGNKYEIIAGERRYKASILAGRESVPVIIKNLNDKESAEVALIENVQRKNLTPIEEAISYKKILDMGYLNQTTLAEKIGKSQSSVANKIRLLNLTDEVQEALLENKISERHARSLLKLNTKAQQNEMLNKIISERLTVRKTDEEIGKLLKENDNTENVEENKIEKGESDKMNNESINTIPTISEPSNQSASLEIPVMTPLAEEKTSETSFMPNIVESTTQSVINEQPSIPSMPELPAMNVVPDSNQLTSETAAMPSLPLEANNLEIPAMPAAEVTTVTMTPEVPVASESMNFELPSMPADVSAPTEVPASPTVEAQPVETTNSQDIQFELPVTAPIIDQSDVKVENVVNEPSQQGVPTVQMEAVEPSASELPLPTEQQANNDPIIITDYSKQYDPIMPNQAEQVTQPKANLKDVIGLIRECSKQIEQMGYKLELEEYDLQDIYQVVFKINK